MSITFPSSPAYGDIYNWEHPGGSYIASSDYVFDGTKWIGAGNLAVKGSGGGSQYLARHDTDNLVGDTMTGNLKIKHSPSLTSELRIDGSAHFGGPINGAHTSPQHEDDVMITKEYTEKEIEVLEGILANLTEIMEDRGLI